MTFQPISEPPRFSPGEVVYLKASAEKGFLESYKVEEVRHAGSSYKYIIRIKPKRVNDDLPPVGDRNDLKSYGTLRFTEIELVTVYEALLLKQAYLTSQLAAVAVDIAKFQNGTSG